MSDSWTLWTVACLAPLSMGLSRKEYWSRLPRLPLGDLPYLGMEGSSLMSSALAGGFFTTSATWEWERNERKVTFERRRCLPSPPFFVCHWGIITQNVWFPVSLKVPTFFCLSMDPCFTRYIISCHLVLPIFSAHS